MLCGGGQSTAAWRAALRRPDRGLDGGFEVRDDVGGVLDADRHPHHLGAHTAGALGFGVSCWWVVEAGWITSVLASPTFASRLASVVSSVTDWAAS